MFKKSTNTTLFILFLIGLTSISYGFDGQRKGFILGLGLGGGLTSFTQTVEIGESSQTSDRENKFSFISDFRIGYAPSNLVEVYYNAKVAWFSLDNIFDESVTITDGLNGIGITYHLKPQAPSGFVNGAIGLAVFDAPFESGFEAWTGFGFSAGGGFEFSPHWRVEGNIIYGKPGREESGVSVSTNSLVFKVTVNVMAF